MLFALLLYTLNYLEYETKCARFLVSNSLYAVCKRNSAIISDLAMRLFWPISLIPLLPRNYRMIFKVENIE